MGICSKTISPWESPLHIVQKMDMSWRPVVIIDALFLSQHHCSYQQYWQLSRIQQDGYAQGILPGPRPPEGHTQNGNHHPIRCLSVLLVNIRITESWGFLPAINGFYIRTDCQLSRAH